MKNRKLADIFFSSSKLSIKNDSYFDTYESIFNSYVGKPITFMEIGCLTAVHCIRGKNTLEMPQELSGLI